MQYQVVSAQGNKMKEALEKLSTEVQKFCSEGWKPQGGVSITYTYFDVCCVCQAMVKESE